MRIDWSESAADDLRYILDFISARSPSGAVKTSDRILNAVALLSDFPRIARSSRHRGLREKVVPRTPYIVIYRVEEDRVEIRAIVHGKQGRRR